MTAIDFRVWYKVEETGKRMQIVHTIFDNIDYLEAAHDLLLSEYRDYKTDCMCAGIKPYKIDLLEIHFF